MALDILVLLVVVVLIFQRLWKVLGTDGGSPRRIKLSKEGAEKLYNLLKSESEKEFRQVVEEVETLVPVDDKPMSDLDKSLARIPDFNRESFIKGAKKAFEMVTSAFNRGDTATLKVLVSADIYQKMSDIIQQRRNDNITAETDFIGFAKAEITKADVNDDKALVSVEFVSEQVNVLRSADGEVLEGDENYIQNITDVWTFERSFASKSSNWLLVSTKK